MPTFQEAVKLARLSVEDKTSSKRMREIFKIIRKYKVTTQGLTPKKAVAILQELGPTFVKLGQIASTHPDVLPKEYCDEFGKLRADVVPVDFDTVVKTINEELGCPYTEVFSVLDEHPLGSASVAQVHRAVLKETGDEVAVKVMRPGVAEVVAKDILLMRRLLATYEFINTSSAQISFEQLLDELERTSKDEMDLTIEMRYLARFHSNNVSREGVKSPRAFEEYSTSLMLTMDFARGPRLEQKGVLEKIPDDKRKDLAHLIAKNWMEQVLDDGFFHADPHLGNMILTSDEDGNYDGIEWIDFGIMGMLTGVEREATKNVMTAIARRDSHGLMKAIQVLVRPTGPIDHTVLLSTCDLLIQQYASVDLQSLDTGALLQDLIGNMAMGGFEFNPSILNVARGLVTLEGSLHVISGDVSIMSAIQEYMSAHFDDGMVEKYLRDLLNSGVDGVEATVGLPTKMADTLDMLQKGQVKAAMSFSADKVTREDLGSSIDHFTLALLAGMLFLGSCILCTTGLEPEIAGVPAFGFFCILAGMVLAIWDLLWMRRDHKRRK